MILTCPECASRYFVADDSISPAGRTVRCSACGARWTAQAEMAVEPVPPHPEPAVGPEPLEADSQPTSEPLPRVFRERAATRQKVRQAAAAGAVWAGLAAGFMLLIGVTVLLRQDIARLWPRTAGAYAMAGLPVNLVGLTIENQHAQPQLQDGHAALVISGALRNIRDRPIVAPPLRISLLNTAGRSLAVKIADPDGARIPPGEARRFVINMLDPPVSATDVDIAFVLDRPPHKGGATPIAGGPPSARLSLRGTVPDGATPALGPVAPGPPALGPPALEPPAPGPAAPTATVRDAKPLPRTSPYALPANGDPAATSAPRG